MKSSEGSLTSSKILHDITPASRNLIDPTNIDTESRRYWEKIFKIMDDYKAVPLHHRENVLEDVLHNKFLIKKLEKICDIHEHPDHVDYDELMHKTLRVELDYYDKLILDQLNLKTVPPRAVFATSPSKEFLSDIPQKRKKSKVDYRQELTVSEEDRLKPENTHYMNFLNKSTEKANRWRPKPPLTIKGMTLGAKCDEIVRDIATDFIDWMNNLGGELKMPLDVKGLESLFEVGFNCHAADSLMIELKELNAVNDLIARSLQKPEASYSTQLYRQLYRDMTAVKPREANFAFGTMLPPSMRAGTSEDSVSKWMQNLRVPEKLATMAVVWEGIESLRITEEYCVWLVEHPVKKPPAYLESKGMLKHLLRKTGKSAVLKSFYAMETLPTSTYNLIN